SASTVAVAPRALAAAGLTVRWRRAGTVLMVDLLCWRLDRIRRPPHTRWVRAEDVLRDGRIAAQGDPDPTLRSGVTGVNGVLPGVMLEASPPASDASNRVSMDEQYARRPDGPWTEGRYDPAATPDHSSPTEQFPTDSSATA